MAACVGPSRHNGGVDYMDELHRSYHDANQAYANNRAVRLRSAMFPGFDNLNASDISTRSSIVDLLIQPTRELNEAVLNLLRFEGESDISLLPIQDLIQMMNDADESIVARAVHRVYLMTKEDRTVASYPVLLESLFRAIKSDNDVIKTNALGAINHISETKDGCVHIFRSGGLAELIRMLYSPIKRVVHYALKTLRNLLQYVPSVRDEARILGAIEALSPLLTRNDPTLLSYVADSLHYLLLEDEQAKIVFLSLGGPKTLVNIMGSFQEHRRLLYTVFRCVRVLSTCEQNKQALIGLGCLPILYQELIRAGDERTEMTILTAMRNLSDKATNEDNVNNLIRTLLEKILDDNIAISACACGILSNLTCNNIRNKQSVCTHHGITTLIHAINRFIDVEDVTEPALCTLRHCTARHDLASQAQHEVRLIGNGLNSFQILITLLSTLRIPIVKATLGVITNCAFIHANVVELMQVRTENGLSVITLTVDILGRAIQLIRDDPGAETEGVSMWGVVESAASALHHMANHSDVARQLCEDPGFISLIVELLARPEVANSDDGAIERELLGLLYQLSKTADGASVVEAAGPRPLIVDALHSQHKSVATYASGILKNLEPNRSVPYQHDFDAGSGNWQRDGLEPELFGEMYPDHGMDNSSFAMPHNNSSWFDTDL